MKENIVSIQQLALGETFFLTKNFMSGNVISLRRDKLYTSIWVLDPPIVALEEIVLYLMTIIIFMAIFAMPKNIEVI